LIKGFDLGVMSCNLFQKIIQQDFYINCSTQETPLKFIENNAFEATYKNYLQTKTSELDKVLETADKGSRRKELITLMTNYVFYCKLFNKNDIKIFKSIWSLQKKAPIIQIAAHVLFKSESFLMAHCNLEAAHKQEPKDMKQFRADYIKTLNTTYNASIEGLQMTMLEWSTKICCFTLSDLPGVTKRSRDLNNIFKIIMSGLNLASRIKTLTDDILLLHYTEQVNLSQPLLLPIIKAIAMLKGIDFEINTKMTQIALLVPLIRRVIQNQLQVVWEDALNSIDKQEKSEYCEFLKYCFSTALTTTKLELNGTHIKFLSLLKPILCSEELIKQKACSASIKFYERLMILENLQKNLYDTTHIPYFYKIRSYSFLFFEELSQSAMNLYLLKYLLRAFEDSKRLLNRVAYLEEKDLLIKQYKAELLNTFHDTITSSLTKAIENSLRKRVNEYYKKKEIENNPMKNCTTEIKYLLKYEPLFLFGERINIKSIIEQTLTKRFYELTTTNIKSWELYEDMKCIAHSLYSLNIQDNLLPPKKLQQGLDLIFIVKNLHYFVSNYHYSLHIQVFFERITKESIEVFGVTQAVNSFNVHGMGIRNTVLRIICKSIKK